MLRRPPTTITVTAEDVAAYEDRRAQEAQNAAQQARAAAAAAKAGTAQQMEGVQSSPAARQQSRDDRIGVRRGGNTGR